MHNSTSQFELIDTKRIKLGNGNQNKPDADAEATAASAL